MPRAALRFAATVRSSRTCRRRTRRCPRTASSSASSAISRDDPCTRHADHLAVLLRARDLRKIKKRTDWDTPGGWRVERHPRLLADITGDGRADIVGFGDAGVWTALSKATARSPIRSSCWRTSGSRPVVGGWRSTRAPRRHHAATAGPDIVGVRRCRRVDALSNGDGTFQPRRRSCSRTSASKPAAGAWTSIRASSPTSPATAGPTSSAFGDDGVWTALGNGDGTFQPPAFVLADLGFEAGGWRVDKHPRFLADITGDGRADIVAFGDAGVWTALSNGDGTFRRRRSCWRHDFGFEAGGWRVDKHPRFLADITGDGRADIVGFGNAGVWTALGNGDGTFRRRRSCSRIFGFEAGGWRVDRHPRFLADITRRQPRGHRRLRRRRACTWR